MPPNSATDNWTELLAFIAAFAALGAFWISWREARRNNKVIAKLSNLSFSYSHTARGCVCKLQVDVLNRGIQMQNISMSLVFKGPGKSGTFQVPIPLSGQGRGVAGVFPRGASAMFVLSSADNGARSPLRHLRNFKEQDPRIFLYNSSFLARSFAIYRRWDWFRRLWNKLSFKLSYQRRVGDGAEGKGVFKTYQLPCFVIRSQQLAFFLTALKEAGGEASCSS